MTKTRNSLWIFVMIAFMSLIVLLSGVAPAPVKAQAPQVEDDDDADLPRMARGRIDKEEYLSLRDAHVNRLRGIPHDQLDARVKAIREMETQERENAPNISTGMWTSIGPAPIPNGQTSPQTPVSGRVASIAVHPTNPNTVYVGTAQGGVYRSTDGGATWTAIFDNALSLAIGALAIAPSNPTTLFVGTGEPNFSCDSFFGVGVYRITNADTTPVLAGPFNQDGSLADVMTGRAVGKIVVHPTDPNVIFVSTTSGIGGIGCDIAVSQPSRGLFRSSNAMAGAPTFTKLTVATANGGNRSIVDVAMEPDTPNNLLCTVLGFDGAGDGGVYRSTNALAGSPVFTRTQVLGTAIATVRGELAINKVGAVVTAFAASGENSGAGVCGTNGTLRRSIDGGQTWSTPIAAGNGFCGGQCFYNISLAVDPSNASNVILGGNVVGSCSKLVSRSTNGGTTFTNVSSGVHADNHVAVYSPSSSSVIYMGTDGGIYKSTDSGATFASINNAGFNATQFQSLALHPTDREFMIGGTQDNGTEFKKADGTWTRADFGDGGFSLIDQSATNTTTVTMYHTYFNQTGTLLGMARVNTSACATEGQWSVRGIYGGAVDPTVHCDGTSDMFNGISISDSVLFYAPIALGPGTPNTVYFGSDKLYRSVNRGDTMTVASQVFAPGAPNVPVSAIGISRQNDNARIVGLANGQVFATTTGSMSMTNVTGPIPARFVARAVIDPNNVNTAYVTLAGFGLAAGQHVWKTTNLNVVAPTWTAAGSGIPDVPVNAFVIDPVNSNMLYAGTDIGVYRSTDSGGSWTVFGTGLPRVAVFDMAIQSTFRVLRIATHGRGIWEISLGGADTIGVYLPSNTTFYLRNSNTAGFADLTIQYGPTGAIPVVGDWNGDATTTIGVYDPTARTFYLRNSNTPGFADLTIQYGPPGAIPLVGDWDGNGTTTIGVYDPASRTFYLRNSNSPGFADLTIQYGPPGAVPIAGDWDGNGTTTIGVYEPSSQTFYLRNSNTPGFADLTIVYGPPGATPLVGDWDGNGTVTIAVYDATNQTFYLRNSNTIGFADLTIRYGPLGATPVPGDWDGL